MNLLDRRKAGLIALLALFLFSCESDDLLSLPFDPKIENINSYYTELTVPFKLVQLDSVNTTNRERILIGNYLNDQFGRVKAAGFTDFEISNKGSISTDGAYDSLSLIVVNNYFYGETEALSPQSFSVHQLSDTLSRRNHYSFETVPYQAKTLGNLTFIPDPDAASSPDTLRIRIDDAIGKDLFEKAKNKSVQLSSDSAFQDYFKGLALIPESQNNYITGFDPASMQLVLYYSAPNETVSSTYTFALGSTITFNHIQYDRSGTAIASISQPGDEGQAANGNFYLQSGTGISPVIDFQPLLNFVSNIENSEEGKNVLFNRVDLHIGLPDTPEGTPPPPAVIRGFEVDENFKRKTAISSNKRIFLGLFADDAGGSREASPINLDTLSAYNMKVTNYMQFLDDGVVEETEMLLLSDKLESSVNHIITEADSVRLQIYYTILE